eukprot:SM000103S09516  [mRNA]  locus=s103:488527:496923:+ [translate_table: standard]
MLALPRPSAAPVQPAMSWLLGDCLTSARMQQPPQPRCPANWLDQPLAASVKGGKVGDEDDLLRLAHQAYEEGKYEQALSHCKTVHELWPSRTDALLLMGAVYYQLHDYDKCIMKIQEAIKANPALAEYYDNMANALKEKGDLNFAIYYYLRAIEVLSQGVDDEMIALSAPDGFSVGNLQVDAHCNLGSLLKAQGYVHQAYLCFQQALHMQPSCPYAWSNMAGILMEAGEYFQALLYFKEALNLKPDLAEALLCQGNIFEAVGYIPEAIVCYCKAIQHRPDSAVAYGALTSWISAGNLANVYYELGQLDSAITNYQRAVGKDPSYLDAYNNLGNALKAAGRTGEAMSCYQSCLAVQPQHLHALINLGNVYLELNQLSEAQKLYERTLTTGLSAPYSSLASIYKQKGDSAAAIACYNGVLRVDPLAADALVNRGNTLKEVGHVSEALQDYLTAVAIRPTMAEGHANLGSAYKDSGHVEAAIRSYKQALLLRPDFPEATCNLLHTLQCVCDWEDREEKFKDLESVVKRQMEIDVLPSVQPFHAIAYPIDPLTALGISCRYAEHCRVLASRLSLPPYSLSPPASNLPGRLHVGYVSSDFGNHPLSHLMGSVFGLHDRQRIKASAFAARALASILVVVFCYALSSSDGSEWRQRIASEAEVFMDISSFSTDQIGERIYDDNIHILVNLNGYTKGARNDIFALRPAPIQISYMGFPGTTGADYIDYLVTDELVSPLCFAHIYSETLVYLPYCYFVNDYKQRNLDILDSSSILTRGQYGLPEDKFLFACFNQLYKMDPDIFLTWCNILKRVPNSALWLLRFPAAGEARLRAFAQKRGVRSDQIIFTDVAAKNEHIRRSALADLFLDTPLCNAHTTGVDVLWAGLPMITLPLQKMATRVAMSLAFACGLGPEMVVYSLDEYEERAVMYATNPELLKALRGKLSRNRFTCPLFDTARWVVNFERALFAMWKLYCRGRHPSPFKILEDDRAFPLHG